MKGTDISVLKWLPGDVLPEDECNLEDLMNHHHILVVTQSGNLVLTSRIYNYEFGSWEWVDFTCENPCKWAFLDNTI